MIMESDFRSSDEVKEGHKKSSMSALFKVFRRKMKIVRLMITKVAKKPSLEMVSFEVL